MHDEAYPRPRGAWNGEWSARRRRPTAVACALGLLGAAAPAATLHAQREQAGIRVETFGGAPLGLVQTCRPSAACQNPTPSGEATATIANVGWGTRRFVGKEGNTVVYNGFLYRYARVGLPEPSRTVVLGGSDALVPGTRDLHMLTYDFMLLRSLSERTSLVVVARPGLFSDLRNVDLSHFRPEGIVFADRVVSEKTTLGLGVAYTSNFGRALPVPVLHVVHVASPKVLVDGLLPARLDVWYYPRKGLELGLNASLNGAQYRVGADDTPLGASTFQLAHATVGPVLRYNVGGKWYASLEAGTSVLRRLRFTTAGATDRYDPDPANRPFVRVGAQLMY